MNFKIFCIFLLIIIISSPSICFSENPDPKEWEYYVTDSKGHVCYYNKTNINKSPNIITVWIYSTVSDSDRKDVIELGKNLNRSDIEKKHQNYDHDNILFEIDCKNKKFKVKETTEYDNKGAVINHYKLSFVPWLNIQPNDIKLEKLFNTLCIEDKTGEKK